MRDIVAGITVLLFGLLFMIPGIGYGLGTFMQMDTGFYPVLIAGFVMITGLFIGGGGILKWKEEKTKESQSDSKVSFSLSRLRPFLYVLSGIAAFALMIDRFGLLPSVFVTTVLASYGDNKATFFRSAMVALVMSVLVWIVFIFGLGLAIPLIKWEI